MREGGVEDRLIRLEDARRPLNTAPIMRLGSCSQLALIRAMSRSPRPFAGYLGSRYGPGASRRRDAWRPASTHRITASTP